MTKEPKKMWRCANDIMAYCSGEPEWKDPPHEEERDLGALIPDCGGRCKLDPETCKKHLTVTQSLEARLRKGAKVAK